MTCHNCNTIDNVEGTGTFALVIKQKKDKLSGIVLEGGYQAV